MSGMSGMTNKYFEKHRGIFIFIIVVSVIVIGMIAIHWIRNRRPIEQFLNATGGAGQLLFAPNANGINAYISSLYPSDTARQYSITGKEYTNVDMMKNIKVVTYSSGDEEKLFTLSNKCYMDISCNGIAIKEMSTTNNTASVMMLYDAGDIKVSATEPSKDTQGVRLFRFPPKLIEDRTADFSTILTTLKFKPEQSKMIPEVITNSLSNYKLISLIHGNIQNYKTAYDAISTLAGMVKLVSDINTDATYITIVLGSDGNFYVATAGPNTTLNPMTSSITPVSNTTPVSVTIEYAISFKKDTSTPTPLSSIQPIYLSSLNLNADALSKNYKKLEPFTSDDSVVSSIASIPTFNKEDSLSVHKREPREDGNPIEKLKPVENKDGFLDYTTFISYGQSRKTPLTTFIF
jgi:hypothetical protein